MAAQLNIEMAKIMYQYRMKAMNHHQWRKAVAENMANGNGYQCREISIAKLNRLAWRKWLCVSKPAYQ